MRVRRSLLVVGATLGLLAGVTPPVHADPTDTYIVLLKNTVSATAVTPSVVGSNAKALPAAHAAIAELTAAKAAALASNPNVKKVIKNARIKATGTQTNPPWDLDVLDSRTAGIDHSYTSPNAGAGVTVYVIDSGLTTANSEFASASVGAGINFVQRGSLADPGYGLAACGTMTNDTTVDPKDTADQAGHGTAVTSLVVGATVGVAKSATVVPVRVLDCNGGGLATDVFLATDWILQNHAAGTPAVVNISLGTTGTILDDAAQQLLDAGITVVAAAGNDNVDACTETPARVPGVITTAATTQAIAEPVWPDGQGTNYGTCVDLYAPGDSVYASSRYASQYMWATGTSFSSPLTAGAAALVLAAHPTYTPAQVSTDLTNRASYGVVSGARSVNKLLNVGPLGTFTGTAPTVSGALYAGETASAVLHWTPAPTTVTYQWQRNGTPIGGATGATYASVQADLNQNITVVATGDYPGYTTVTATSDPWVPAQALLMTPGSPTIKGTPAVTCPLVGDPGVWDPADGTQTYQWRRDGVNIPAATSLTYTPTTADLGHLLTFAVTSTKTGYLAATAVSQPTAAVQSATSQLAYAAFVRATYQDFLGRPAEEWEVNVRVASLAGGYGKLNYLNELANSDEWLKAIVTSFYQNTLGRAPDAGGLSNWIGELRSRRLTVAQVAAQFYASEEFYTLHAGATNQSWVTELYRQILHREPDAGGLTAWTNLTNSGRMNRGQIAENFYQSNESRMDRVSTLYQELLKRTPDPTGWPYWTVQVLYTGDIWLAVSLSSSEEYWSIAHTRY